MTNLLWRFFTSHFPADPCSNLSVLLGLFILGGILVCLLACLFCFLGFFFLMEKHNKKMELIIVLPFYLGHVVVEL